MSVIRPHFSKVGTEHSENFMRSVRNFMNNWVVEGGSFSFDGYRAKLRINPGSTASTATHPFQVTRNDAGSTKRVSIRPGTINSVVPTNIFSPLTITGSGAEYVLLTATFTGDSPVSAALSIETTIPVPSATTPTNTPTAVKDVIAAIYDGTVYQIRNTNLTVTSVEVFQETVASPSPGERNYIPWYRWEVSG